MIFMGY